MSRNCLIIVQHSPDSISLSALNRFVAKARAAANLKGEVSILITSNDEVQALNHQFRHKNKPTDVLSFPSDAPGLAGDIAISAEIAGANGQALGHGLVAELKILILHGMLHLAGHDHEVDDGEMAALESKLRARLGLDHGLIERAHGISASPKRKPAKKLVVRKVTAGKKAAKKVARSRGRSSK